MDKGSRVRSMISESDRVAISTTLPPLHLAENGRAFTRSRESSFACAVARCREECGGG